MELDFTRPIALANNPLAPEPERNFSQLKIGTRYGSRHGGFEVLDGDLNKDLDCEAVCEEEGVYASVIAPFADVYFAPRFKVFQHGKTISQNFVDLLIPRNARWDNKGILISPATIYFRRPAILVSTSKAPTKSEDMKREICAVAFKLVLNELRARTGSNPYYDLAESVKTRAETEKTNNPRVTSWEEATEILSKRWAAFVDARIATKDDIEKDKRAAQAVKDDSAARFTPVHAFNTAIWTGEKGTWIANQGIDLELARDLNRHLVPSPTSRQTTALTAPGM